MITTYVRLAIIALAIAALLGENFWIYRKGQNSIISNVVAGVATTVKQQDTLADAAVQQATADAITQTTIKQETHVRHEKLQASVTANPRASCVLTPDELSSLQAAASATKP